LIALNVSLEIGNCTHRGTFTSGWEPCIKRSDLTLLRGQHKTGFIFPDKSKHSTTNLIHSLVKKMFFLHQKRLARCDCLCSLQVVIWSHRHGERTKGPCLCACTYL